MNHKVSFGNRIIKTLLAYAFVFIMLISLVNAAGLGVSPSEVFFDQALKGSTYIQDLKIDNTGESDIIADIQITGFNDWFRFDPGMSVKVLAKGSSSARISLTVPPATPNGIYESVGFIKGNPAVAGQGMGLIPGVGFKIKVNVTDQRIAQGFVDNILTRDTVLNKNVMFLIGFMNKGNVPIAPRAKFIIKDQDGNNIDNFDKQFTNVNPGVVQTLIAEYETMGKPLGSYQAFVQVYLDSALLLEKTVYFKILDQMPGQTSPPPSPGNTPTPPSPPSSAQTNTSSEQQASAQASTGSGPKITLITAETGPAPSGLKLGSILLIIAVAAVALGLMVGIAIGVSRMFVKKNRKADAKKLIEIKPNEKKQQVRKKRK